jgi:(2S)-methylsuccinyl-CoA dehydrogenase
MSEWITLAKQACGAAADYAEAVRLATLDCVAPGGKPDAALMEQHQRRVHGLAWIGTTIAALEATSDWAARAQAGGRFSAMEELILRAGFGEYLHQLTSALAMSQGEYVRPSDLGTRDAAQLLSRHPAVSTFLEQGNTAQVRADLTALLAEGMRPDEVFEDETLDLIRTQFRAFTADRITPYAHQWHLDDALIPDAVIAEMADLGVFGVCIAEEFGGLGLGKLAMCLVSEELSRGWICAGSLGTRSEIAGELIGGKRHARAKGALLAGHCRWFHPAHCGVYRARYRLRPRLSPHTRGAAGRWWLADHWRKDLDYTCCARRSHDGAVPN